MKIINCITFAKINFFTKNSVIPQLFQAESVRDAAWGCDWVGTPVPFQRCLAFIIATANKGFTLTAGKFIPVSNKTMISVSTFIRFCNLKDVTKEGKPFNTGSYIITLNTTPSYFHAFNRDNVFLSAISHDINQADIFLVITIVNFPSRCRLIVD
jgi:hypothetical protein